ncbi:MAG TPA: hypothetical protein DEG06_04230 [Lachnospiraceae bacterium]|nr:hypothetical protein [Lachnospiraceae bacterium]
MMGVNSNEFCGYVTIRKPPDSPFTKCIVKHTAFHMPERQLSEIIDGRTKECYDHLNKIRG